ncbi:hypothetical protein B2I21_08485 [Chryseobacterium mucoviscidosis]|nr:hypothetical protein B2I21_08485 [Chryseobacterium mucoviscidosis]
MKTVWLISKKDGKASAYRMAEQDVEGYVNVLRDKGFNEFEIATTEYGINNQGRYEVDTNDMGMDLQKEFDRSHEFIGHTSNEIFQLGMQKALELAGIELPWDRLK